MKTEQSTYVDGEDDGRRAQGESADGPGEPVVARGAVPRRRGDQTRVRLADEGLAMELGAVGLDDVVYADGVEEEADPVDDGGSVHQEGSEEEEEDARPPEAALAEG